jgi:redox-sensitive bicupin YhaK (pirin superfamily)
MKTILHKASSRGHANHGWLNTYHTFSFGQYYNPERIRFGLLRVLNDDTIEAGTGFGTHPHDNMEIISIPLSGALEHRDSMGNIAIIHQGDVQVMSAGSGVSHSEFNKNKDQKAEFLQIWVFPDKKNVEPRYDQISLNDLAQKGELYQILSPSPDDQGVWIHQQAWFFMGEFDEAKILNYQFRKEENGLYIFVIEGSAEAAGHKLGKRDGMGISETSEIPIKACPASKILLMEVPMG